LELSGFLLLKVAFSLGCLVVGLLAGGDAGALLGVFAWFAVIAYLLPFLLPTLARMLVSGR